MTKVLSIGNVYLDITSLNVPFDEKGLIPETEIHGDSYSLQPGSSALNFAHQCVLLGLESVFIGKIGKDKVGQVVTELMSDWHIEALLIEDGDQSTNLGLNFTNTDGQMISTGSGSANLSLTSQEVTERAKATLNAISYLYIGGCFKLPQLLPAFHELANLARSAGVKVVVDHNRIPINTNSDQKEAVRQLALAADYYLPSRDEFLELWEVDSIERGLEQLQNQTNAQVVVKDGSRGATTLIRGKVLHAPAYEVALLHTVGAGDSFNAGFTAGQANGLSLEKSLQFGCATAALKISQPSLPNRQEVESLLNGK